MFRRLVARGRRCYLCNGLPQVVGCYAPHDQAGCQAPPGKVRTLWYLLCDQCLTLPDCWARVEARVRREVATWPASPEVN
jgi:hypothetical protein